MGDIFVTLAEPVREKDTIRGHGADREGSGAIFWKTPMKNGHPVIEFRKKGGDGMAKEKTAYFEWLRLLAAAAVVMMHTAGSKWMSFSYTLPVWEHMTRWDSLVRWPVPIFIMITGALFLPRKTGLKTMVTRYIPRIVICYLIWSYIYAAEGVKETLEKVTPEQVAAGRYHLWYLPYLCGVYLTIPFLQKIAEDDRLTDQLLGVSLIFGALVPWLVKAGAFFLPEQAKLLQTLGKKLNYPFFLNHLSLLLLGHRLHKTELRPWQRRTLYVLGLAAVAVTGPATIWITEQGKIQNSLFFEICAPNNLLAAAAIFVFARQHLTKLPRPVAFLAKCSFGVYLCHDLVLTRLAEEGYHVLTYDAAWYIPVLAAEVFLISLVIAAVLRSIPLVGKYLA